MAFNQANEEVRHEAIVQAMKRLPIYPFQPFVNACLFELYHEVKHFPGYTLFEKLAFLWTEAFYVNDDMLRFVRRDMDYSDDTIIFQAFQGKQTAEIFREFVCTLTSLKVNANTTEPHMVSVMKHKAKNQSYNLGYKELVLLYDKIAKDPDHYIKAAQALIDNTKETVDESSVEEHFIAMEWRLEHEYETLSNTDFLYRSSK